MENENYVDSSPLLQQQQQPPPPHAHSNRTSSPAVARSQYGHERDDSEDLTGFSAVQPTSALDYAAFRPPPSTHDQNYDAATLASTQYLAPRIPQTPARHENRRFEDVRLSPRESHRLSIRGRPARVRSLNLSENNTRQDLERSKSLLQALSPSAIRRTILTPTERYSTIQELDDLAEEDHIEVDISLLEGPESTATFSRHVAPPDMGSKSGPNISPAPTVRVETPLGRKSTMSKSGIEDTMRLYGQQLAEERRMIVSVKESAPVVDLSTLGGAERQMPGTMGLGNRTTLGHDEASFYYPTDPEKPDWKPISMKTPYMLMLIITSLVLAGVQEYLYQRSRSLEDQGQGLIQYDTINDIPVAEFFAWKYLPTMVMVAFGVLWQLMEYNVKRLEPYYQLSQPTGNSAAKSLNLDYITTFPYFVPIKAIRNGHWTVAVASIGAILATTAAPSLQNPSLVPTPNPNCKNRQCTAEDETKHIVQVHSVWSRLVTVTLVLVAVMATVLLFQLRRKSGLLSDPKGIAGIASMATKSHILNDFQGMDEATEIDIHKKLRHRRYVLYKSSIWQGEYMRHTENLGHNDQKNKVHSPHPIILRLAPGIAFLTYLAFLVALVPIITYTPAKVVAIDLPWLPVLLAVVAKQIWSTLEFSVKMLEPYYALSRGNARPESTLTLDYQGSPYGLVPFQAILNRHYTVALAGFGSVLADVLTVTSSSLTLQYETVTSFEASSSVSSAVIIFLFCSATLIFLRRRHAFLPRQPSTIASVLAFIHQSRMLDDFVNTERFSNDKMRSMLVGLNKRYGLGWFRGRDGKPHCGIDEEPMLSKYVHGVSYRHAQAPWEDSVGF
ncbi:hypothetical protein BGW36DRAFT_298765 [Talaromyces proteolyticus]|uniref:DUF3433 domain containing protein n=1 Tax=Talaromyces proteolyticus TaxID=1131652 RepID=A0AAD4KPQ1_9EURO|nr:uncharacterized protein BGW36DRAFT_298765 [Talaromyces proteolyticus]KAH8695453.1 hypothetical protein BGW36DRAFT_298765 [Talaromyces proteolyticus]